MTFYPIIITIYYVIFRSQNKTGVRCLKNQKSNKIKYLSSKNKLFHIFIHLFGGLESAVLLTFFAAGYVRQVAPKANRKGIEPNQSVGGPDVDAVLIVKLIYQQINGN